MGNSAAGWTLERRQRQSQAIKVWKPWSQSTGPRTEEGKSEVSKNAYKGGHYAKLQELKRAINKEIMLARDRLNSKPFK